MRHIFSLILTGLLLAGCAGLAQPGEPPAVEPPPGITLLPEMPITPLPPTATAVVFRMLPTSTALPTRPPQPTLANDYGVANFQPDTDPLTGLKVDEPQLLNRRPLAIKVTNFPRSVRPQWGLSAADHVYEYYLEADLTRFIGVFYGKNAPRVGPVRSGRFFDENIMRMYKSVLVFGYADDPVIDTWMKSDLRGHLVVEQPDNCPPLCRIGPKNAYNTLFADTAGISKYVVERGSDNSRQNLDGMQFAESPIANTPGEKIYTRFSLVSYNYWQYDPASGRYLRFQDTEDSRQGEGSYAPLMDSQTGAQLAADNVVILLMEHDYYKKTSSTEIFQMNFTGTGPAYAFRDGHVTALNWRRDSPDMLIALEYPDGQVYSFKPGNTWFEVLGQTSKVQPGDDGVWHFEFNIP